MRASGFAGQAAVTPHWRLRPDLVTWGRMKTGSKLGPFAIILVVMAALLFWQQHERRRLVAEAAALREQVVQEASLHEENTRLAEQLKTVAAASEADRKELLRLRALASKLRLVEQENAQMKIERQRLVGQPAQANPPAARSPETQAAPDAEPKLVAPPANTTDLGEVEIADREPVRFDLGAGQTCLITPTVLADGNVLMEIAVEGTAADGTAAKLGQSRLTARPGQQCAISVGDRMIALSAKIRAQ